MIIFERIYIQPIDRKMIEINSLGQSTRKQWLGMGTQIFLDQQNWSLTILNSFLSYEEISFIWGSYLFARLLFCFRLNQT